MYEMPIERGKIREFARAAHGTHSSYHGVNAVIPPTFLTIARLSWDPERGDVLAQLGFDRRRVLHGEEEYIFFGPPPRAGQSLQVTSRIADRYDKEGKQGGAMRFAVIVTEFRNGTGTLVAEQRSTVVETARPPSDPLSTC